MVSLNPLKQGVRFLWKKRSSQAGVIIVLAFALLIALGPVLIPYSPYQISSYRNGPPTFSHLLGTDYLGRDILSQLTWGAFPSMLVGLTAALGATVIGLLVGVVGGYFSKLEDVLLGTSDVILTFPPLPLLILLGLLYPELGNLIILAMILVLWPPLARAVFSIVLSLKKRPFTDAARASGASNSEIIFKIMIPEVFSVAFAYFVLNAAIAIVLITVLEFLGVGDPNIVSWGSMFYWAEQFAFYNGDWWWILAPGLAITLVATGFALIGFSVEEAMNPRLRI